MHNSFVNNFQIGLTLNEYIFIIYVFVIVKALLQNNVYLWAGKLWEIFRPNGHQCLVI